MQERHAAAGCLPPLSNGPPCSYGPVCTGEKQKQILLWVACILACGCFGGKAEEYSWLSHYLNPPPKSWQETQTFQSLKDDLHQYFVKRSTKNVKIRRTRAPRTLNPASLRCPATLTLAYCSRGNHVLKTKGKSKVPNHTRKGIRPGEPGISCQVMELFSLRPSFYFCYRPKPVKMRVCKIRSDL